ncbi:MAG: DUF4282 domain-containing protein [Planctomycetota bacterium]|jgi:hypothetical protein
MEEDKKCFCSCLFDLSFDELITKRIIKILYVIGIVISGLVALSLIVMAFTKGFGLGLLHVIAAPIVFMLLVVIVRVKMELLLTLFRIEENTRTPAPVETATPAPAEEAVEPEPVQEAQPDE